MVEAVRQRISDSNGELTVWAVLEEDTWETCGGDGFYVHVKGVTLTKGAAAALVSLTEKRESVRWYVRSYRLGIIKGLPAFLDERLISEEFDISLFVIMLAEISASGIASKLNIGTGRREAGPFVTLPPDWKEAPSS